MAWLVAKSLKEVVTDLENEMVDMIFSPHALMGAVNVLTGIFSAMAGFKKAFASAPSGETNLNPLVRLTSNPWLYVAGGLFTALIGIGNWYHLLVATYASGFMAVASFVNAWFGAAKADWRFWTLNGYVIVMTCLIWWSSSAKQL